MILGESMLVCNMPLNHGKLNISYVMRTYIQCYPINLLNIRKNLFWKLTKPISYSNMIARFKNHPGSSRYFFTSQEYWCQTSPFNLFSLYYSIEKYFWQLSNILNNFSRNLPLLHFCRLASFWSLGYNIGWVH